MDECLSSKAGVASTDARAWMLLAWHWQHHPWSRGVVDSKKEAIRRSTCHFLLKKTGGALSMPGHAPCAASLNHNPRIAAQGADRATGATAGTGHDHQLNAFPKGHTNALQTWSGQPYARHGQKKKHNAHL